MPDNVQIRDAQPADQDRWQQLWAGYLAFYESRVSPEITARTRQRIQDPASAMFCRVAERDGRVIGFSTSVLHDSTWTATPGCYLEDLFVDPGHRGQGVGRRLLEDLVSLAKERGWSRLYWHTRDDNPARKLYDEFVTADRFVRYRLRF